MAVLLEGGCRVADMREDAPQVQGELISMRVLEIEPGVSHEFRNEDRDEVFFSLGNCTVVIEGVEHEVEPETGIFLRAGERFAIQNQGSASFVFLGDQSPSTDEEV